MILEDDTSIDWALCVELSNHNVTLANDLLTLFIEDMPNARRDIIAAYEAGNDELLCDHAHKLHGACCYCGVPKLKQIVCALEGAAKEKATAQYTPLINLMKIEMDAVTELSKHPDLYKK